MSTKQNLCRLTAYSIYHYPGHWIHFNAALTVHNFHSPGSNSMLGVAACDNGAGKFKHN